MNAFSDGAYSREITLENSITVGERVFVRIQTTKSLPSNINFYLTDCTAYKNFEDKTIDSFDMVNVSIKYIKSIK